MTDEHIVPYVDASTASPAIAEALQTLPVERNIAKLLAHSKCFFSHLMKTLSCCWADNRTLRSSEWQLVVLRTAAALDAPYEWDINEPVAKLFGFDTADKLRSIRTGDLSNRGFFTDRHRLINDMANQLNHKDSINEPTLRKAQQVFNNEELLEIMIINGVYTTLARIMRSCRIDFDPPIDGLDSILQQFNAKAIAKEAEFRKLDWSAASSFKCPLLFYAGVLELIFPSLVLSQ